MTPTDAAFFLTVRGLMAARRYELDGLVVEANGGVFVVRGAAAGVSYATAAEAAAAFMSAVLAR